MKLIKLEDRIVLDGAVVDTIEEVTNPVQVLDEQGLEVQSPEVLKSSSNLSIVAHDLEDVETLVSALQDQGDQVLIVNSQKDSIDSILNKVIALTQVQKADQLKIFSHGEQGSFDLGNQKITQENASQFLKIKSVFSEEGQLRIYGCHTASGHGLELIQSLSQTIDKTVLGSDDISGLGGDWDLEVSSEGPTSVDKITGLNIAKALSHWKGHLAGPTETNPSVWLRADSLSLNDGDKVSSWADVDSGSGFTATQNVVIDQPTYVASVLNGQPGLRFDKVSDFDNNFMHANNIINIQGLAGFTIFSVVKTNDPTQSTWIRQDIINTDSGKFIYRLDDNEVSFNYNDASAVLQSANSPDGVTNTGTIAAINARDGDNVLMVMDHNVESNTISNSYSQSSTTATIGGKNNVVGFDGEIMEILIYSQELDAIEHVRIENILADKYGLSGDKYDYDTGDGESFVVGEITGIGKFEGRAALDSATSSIVTIDTPSSLGDNDFLLVSHDNDSTAVWGGTDAPSGTVRIDREWRVDVTNDPGTVSVTFDVASLPAAPAGFTEYVMMLDHDGEFHTNTNSSTGMTSMVHLEHVSGTQYRATGVQFEAGQYFTLGMQTSEPPVLTVPSSSTPIAFTEGDSAVQLDASTSVADDDSADFDGGTLEIDIVKNNDSGDRISLVSGGSVSISGTAVEVSGSNVGTITSNGEGTTKLIVTFNSNADANDVSLVARQLTYNNVSDNPTAGEKVVRYIVRDGDGGVSSEVPKVINMTAVNDDPTVGTNTNSTVNEGDTLTLSNTKLEITDPEEAASSITLTLTDLPDNGVLKLNGSDLNLGDTFTQDDIDNDRLTYVHNGSETTSDSFAFTGSDGVGGTLGATTHNITVTPVNDAPVLATNATTTVNEAATVTIPNTELRVTDVEQSETALTYTLTDLPDNGVLKLNGSDLNLGESFTQDDLDNSRITYQHGGSETTSDSFKFTVSDGDGGSIAETTHNITVTPVNDAPSLSTNSNTSVAEGASATVTDSNLEITDPEQSTSNITLTLTDLPDNGTLKLNGSDLNLGDTFTQDDIDNNRVTYQHDGSETTSDSFSFTAADGVGGNLGATTHSITVTPVNDAPTVAVNTTSTVNEGATLILSNSQLRMTDVDHSSTQIVYTLTDLTDNGTLKLNGSDLNLGDTFTQDDIDNSRITFVHDGSETTSDSFQFTVTDGVGGNIGNTTHNISITPVNDAPIISNNTTTTVSEGSSVNIPNTELRVTDIEQSSVQLVFSLVDLPNNGTLQLNGSPLTLSDTFTQDDIDNGRIAYVHDGSETTSDSFDFNVSDGAGGTLGVTTHSFSVSPVNDVPVLNTNTSTPVSEGSSAVITNTQLSVTDVEQSSNQLTYTLVDLVDSGTLFLNNVELGLNDTFTQDDINNGRVSYTHDGSETTSDSFDFTVSDGSGGSISITSHSMTISPVNDAPIESVNNSTSVLEGESVTLSPSLLQITDVEQSAGDLQIVISTQPAHGTLFLNGNEIKSNESFTQDDIDNGRITYTHDGSETTSDAFQFSVSDGVGGQLSSVIHNITVTPVDDLPTVQAGQALEVPNGGKSPITTEHIVIEDPDTPSNEIVIIIIDAGEGSVEIEGQTVSSVTLKEIEEGIVEYNHRGGSDGGEIQISVESGSATERVEFSFPYTLLESTDSLQILEETSSQPLEVFDLTTSQQREINYRDLVVNHEAVQTLNQTLAATTTVEASSFELVQESQGVQADIISRINDLLEREPAAAGLEVNADLAAQRLSEVDNRFASSLEVGEYLEASKYSDLAVRYNGLGYGKIDGSVESFERFADVEDEENRVDTGSSTDIGREYQTENREEG